MKYRALIIPMLFSIIFIAVGCKSSQNTTRTCYSKYMTDLIIRWGTHYDETSHSVGYQLNTDGSIYAIEKDSLMKDFKKNFISRIDSNRYCAMMQLVRDTILKYQALFEPGDTLRFIEFTNHYTKAYSRAVWNPRFKTAGSSGFRAVFDSLSTLQPILK